MKRTDTIIIGGGQAGLAMSRCLSADGIDHVVLERGRVAERWRSERWDSLRLLSPRWHSQLPGLSHDGEDPDGFMTMPELIAYFERYAQTFNAPVPKQQFVSSSNPATNWHPPMTFPTKSSIRYGSETTSRSTTIRFSATCRFVECRTRA